MPGRNLQREWKVFSWGRLIRTDDKVKAAVARLTHSFQPELMFQYVLLIVKIVYNAGFYS